jgi:hypothetical protein
VANLELVNGRDWRTAGHGEKRSTARPLSARLTFQLHPIARQINPEGHRSDSRQSLGGVALRKPAEQKKPRKSGAGLTEWVDQRATSLPCATFTLSPAR